MDRWFTVKTKEKDTVAALIKKDDAPLEQEEVTIEVLSKWLRDHNIQHGIRHEVLLQIAQNDEEIDYPVEIARGSLPVDGEPAELIPVIGPVSAVNSDPSDRIDFKRLFIIPSVSAGQLLARKKPATEGKPGITVFGTPLPAKKGKDLLVKNGDNTVFDHGNLGVYATANGEVNFQQKCVHVYPVYKVAGDLSLKTGHIDFVGNVHVTGDVPSGYKISAMGDVRIEGVVEAAEIVTPGSVVIGGGVLGQGKGSIRCGGNFTSLYINQGTVTAGENIEVERTILHSQCEAGNNIICTSGKGNITGGTTTAGNIISANEIGNETYSKTFIYMKTKMIDLGVITDIEQKIQELENSLEKLHKLKDSMSMPNGNQATVIRIEKTINQTSAQIKQLYNEKNKLSLHDQEGMTSEVFVKGTLHPNVEISIGKYKRTVQSPFQSVKVYMEDKEIIINSYNEMDV